MRFAFFAIVTAVTCAAQGDDPSFLSQREFAARDSLDIGDEPSDDARDCLNGLKWDGAEFKVRCESSRPGRGDALVRFASPVESADARNDLVAMEWYVARDEARNPIRAPAVVVVHESGSSMTVGRLFAFGLNQHGLHAFLIHLPFYGERRTENNRPDASNIVTLIRQAVADVRRARDAVAVLPFVDETNISLQGTSLGGFVSATTAGLDHGYDSVFLMLAGGDLCDIIQNGKKDTAKVRQRLEQAGLTGDKLLNLTRTIEPLRLAHRLDPKRTWLFSGRYDTVVPLKNAEMLAHAARLGTSHHILMESNHYSGIICMPIVLKQIADHVKSFSSAQAIEIEHSSD